MRHPSRSRSAGWAWRACSQHGSLRAALPGSRPQWRCGSSMLQDLRSALRGFRHAPAFVATVVLTIALCLGLNTSVFTIFDAYVLRPLAIRDPGSLFEVFFQDRRGWGRSLSWRQYQDLRALPISSESFAHKSAFARSERGPMLGNVVTGEAFRVLGAAPALGRTLLPEDATLPHGEPVLVLSYDAWRGKFGGDSGLVGRKIVVHGIPLTVVGVAAKRFTGIGRTLPPDFWAPVTLLSRLEGSDDLFGAKEPEVLRAVLRLKPGVDERQARAALLTWAAHATATLPDSVRWTHVDLVSVASALPLTPETIAMFTPAVVAFGLVLLIACANVANVMLARGIARQRETGLRPALGSARAPLARQPPTQNAPLASPPALARAIAYRPACARATSSSSIWTTMPALQHCGDSGPSRSSPTSARPRRRRWMACTRRWGCACRVRRASQSRASISWTPVSSACSTFRACAAGRSPPTRSARRRRSRSSVKRPRARSGPPPIPSGSSWSRAPSRRANRAWRACGRPG